jgi:hypothetical protein
VSELVGFLRKILISVQGYEQDRVQPIISRSISKVNFIVLVPYMDMSLSVFCHFGTSKKLYTHEFLLLFCVLHTSCFLSSLTFFPPLLAIRKHYTIVSYKLMRCRFRR